jgi:hypothetical protein
MKFELNRPIDYSKEAMINEIKRVALIVGWPLSKDKFNRNSKYSASTIEKKFDNWSEALKSAGLKSIYIYRDNKDRRISVNDIITKLKEYSKNTGETSFSQKEFCEYYSLNRSVFSNKKINFNKIMKELNFTTPKRSRKYTDDDRFENLLTVWTFYGRQPNYDEMKKYPSVVGPKAYVTRWGSWRKALEFFIEKINFDNVSNKEYLKEYIDISTKTNIEIKKEDKREIPLGLRFSILKRDNYKCVICGRSPATTMGIELHIDHIIPFSKGGKTIVGNLQTLCNECNIGKSNKI